MIKKIIAVTLLSAMTLFALPNDELDLTLISKAAHKKVVVLSNMSLKGETKEKFGDLYDEYQIKLMELSLKKLALIGHYAKNYQNMTNTNAKKLLVEWAEVDITALRLKAVYMDKFTKIMPSSAVIRYFQIENRMKLTKEIEIANLIPLSIPAGL